MSIASLSYNIRPLVTNKAAPPPSSGKKIHDVQDALDTILGAQNPEDERMNGETDDFVNQLVTPLSPLNSS
jgi:hypothetical protein